jgi:5-methylcytosine-specific restriction protein B
MARFTDPNRDTTPVYEAAEAFRNRCLRTDGSLFLADSAVWSAANLGTLKKAFVDTPDESERTFEEKFEDQVKPGGQPVIRLAAEALAVYFLFPRNVTGRRKRELVNKVLSWGGDSLPEDHLVSRAFDCGIGGCGQGYSTRRPFELAFIVNLASEWKKLSAPEIDAKLEDPWAFQAFADDIEGADTLQLSHVLLHLLYPDSFERIATGPHKRRLVQTFSGLLEKLPENCDRALLDIRNRLSSLLRRDDLDFYQPPLRGAWWDSSEVSDEFGSFEAVLHKKQVVMYGPPGTGKTYRARQLAERIIRSAAITRWGASTYFTEHKRVQQVIDANVHYVQLHPAFSYEDFIRGLHLTDNKTEFRPGVLLNILDAMKQTKEGAENEKRLPHVLILDEMNRTDLSRMLGECFSALENREVPVTLSGVDPSGRPLKLTIPDDLYVIGTMNLIDQSIEQVDFALRRRFLWVLCPFDEEVLLQVIEYRWTNKPAGRHGWDRVEHDFKRLAFAASALNQAIRDSDLLGPQYEIGHTYFFDAEHFLRQELEGVKGVRKTFLWKRAGGPLPPVEKLWHLSLRPLLREYLAGLREQERKKELKLLEKIFFSSSEPAE